MNTYNRSEKVKKNLLLISVILLFGVILIGCSENSANNTNNNDTNNEKNSEFDPDDTSDWPSNIRLGTASVGGLFNVYGSGLTTIIEKELDIPSSPEQTSGANDNIQLIEVGDIELGMAPESSIYEG